MLYFRKLKPEFISLYVDHHFCTFQREKVIINIGLIPSESNHAHSFKHLIINLSQNGIGVSKLLKIPNHWHIGGYLKSDGMPHIERLHGELITKSR